MKVVSREMVNELIKSTEKYNALLTGSSSDLKKMMECKFRKENEICMFIKKCANNEIYIRDEILSRYYYHLFNIKKGDRITLISLKERYTFILRDSYEVLPRNSPFFLIISIAYKFLLSDLKLI